MPNFVYIAASIDGFIATPEGGVDWLADIPNRDHSDFGFAAFMARMDAVLMGRRTFEKVLSFGEWPYDKPVFVASRKLDGVPDGFGDKAEIVRGTPESLVRQMKRRECVNLYIDGGQLIQSFLREDLIDEMIVTRVSTLLGNGIPLFGSLPANLKFTVRAAEVLNSRLVKQHYVRARE